MNTKIENAPKQFLFPKIFSIPQYRMIILSFLLSAGGFYFIGLLEKSSYNIYIGNYYVVIHTIAEFASIIMYIASFLVIFYVGERDRRLRMKVLGSVLLFVGLVNFWYVFSYNGMPGLFVYSSIPAATTYWIIGRVVLSGGILVSGFISLKVEVKKINKKLLAGVPILLAIFLLIYISYFSHGLSTLFIEGQSIIRAEIISGYIILFMLLVAFVIYAIEICKNQSTLLAIFLSALVLSIFSELVFINHANIYDIYNLLGHIFKLIASYMIFKVLFISNIHFPYAKLDRAEEEISKYANNLEQLVELRTQEIHQANEAMVRDLEYAKTIQKAIMSEKHETYGNIEIYSEYLPYEKVGGDYYGFEDLNNDYLAFYIGDVAGHGIPAAMMTIFMKQTIISQKIYESGIKEIFSPKEVLINLYKKYNDTEFPLEMYAVMIYGVYNKKSKDLIYSSAGLNTYPLVYRQEGVVEVLKHTGFPICKFDKEYKPPFKDYYVPLNQGDKILFYTDGLVGVANRKGEVFGEERLVKLFQEKGQLSLESLSEKILEELNEFAKGVKINDDVHYFIMEVKDK